MLMTSGALLSNHQQSHRALRGIQLLTRAAREKLNVDHYAVGIGPDVAHRVWGEWGSWILELKPSGLTRQLCQSEIPWTPLTAATDLQAATYRLLEVIGASATYRLLGNNCEHFARYVVTGRRESTQVDSVMKAIGMIAGITVMAKLVGRAA